LDVHKRTCYGTVTDDEGHIVKSGRFSSDSEGISEFMEGLEEAQIVMEAGYCWQPIYDSLVDAGHDVRLAHPQKVKAIAEAKVKTDKVDARTLAGLLRADMLPTCYVPGEELRSRRELLRHRLNLVKIRSEVKNRIHALLDKHGLRMPSTTPFSKGNVAWLKERSLGFMDDAILRSDLALLETVDVQVGLIEEKIAALAAEDRRVRLLMTMTGVGYFTAMLIVSEVGDASRFRSDKAFASWMGLAPSVHQSGERTRIGASPARVIRG
jgi:transposase